MFINSLCTYVNKPIKPDSLDNLKSLTMSFNLSSTSLGEILDRITALSLRINSAASLDEMLNITVQQTRELLDCDRVLIYQFLPDGDGAITAESVGLKVKSILGELIYDPCFAQKWWGLYLKGKFSVIEDTQTKPLA